MRVADQLVEKFQEMGGDVLDGGALRLDGCVIAAGDRPGEGALGTVLGEVLDGAPQERHEHQIDQIGACDRASCGSSPAPAAMRSAAACSVTRKLDATEAAAW